MRTYKFCWINSLVIAVFLCGCASVSQPVKLSKSEIRTDKVFEYYCTDNKQIRKLNVSIEYVTPSFPNMVVDKAAEKQVYYSKRKAELLKRTLFSLSGGEERPNDRGADYLMARQSKLNHKDLIEKVSGYVLKESSYSSMSIRPLLMKPNDSNRFILFYGVQTDMRFPDQDYNEKIQISELQMLMDNFTILEPVDFQNEAYKSDLIAADENGKQSISEAIEHKDKIWIRYVEHFTKISEAKSNNPRVINIDLDLDLNGFCRYGRNVSDLQSQ